MKMLRTSIPLFLILLLPGFLPAQPNLTSFQVPQAGEVYIHDWMNNAPVQIPDEGANVIWDLSQNTFNSLEDSGQYRSVFSTIGDWTYNLGFRYFTPAQPRYDLYQVSSSGLRYSGYNRSDQAIDTLILTQPSPVLPVPISYGGLLNEPLAGRYVNNGVNFSFGGATRIKADAWGTLILPWTAYNDILRIHVYDSLNVFGVVQINSSYYYYSASEANAVMVIQDKNPPTGYAIRRGVPVSLHGHLRQPINVYPNPVVDRCWLELPASGPGEWLVELRDLSGKMLRRISAPGGGASAVQVDLQDLPAGMYQLQARKREDEMYFTGKLVKL